MNTTRTLGLSFLIAAILLPVAWLRADPVSIQDYRGFKYVTGGVGKDERDYLKSVEHQFNLGLMFAAQGGAYLSSVRVLIEDSRGSTILDAVAEGPYFYAALPPGSYTVTASIDQQRQRKAVNLRAGRLTRADFYWK